MLRFACVSERDLEVLRATGLPADLLLVGTLAEAEAAGGAYVLVVELPDGGGPPVIRNLDPYEPPRAVCAAGGVVLRPGPEVLLIHRRGVWDLPKGKCKPGESVPDCALREVAEEVGAERLHLADPLGTTLHAYPEKGRCCVKTTHWFVMHTPEERFTPQAEEHIDAVEWTPLARAADLVAFPVLRNLLQEVAGSAA